jgi:8-oxo-dGTP pyrophosphatase MutT (NUDIX family)
MKPEIKVVGAVIFNKQNQVLCAKRSAEMSMPGKWEFPGGKVEPDDNVTLRYRSIWRKLHTSILLFSYIW